MWFEFGAEWLFAADGRNADRAVERDGGVVLSGTLNATGSITGSTGIISTNGQFYARTAVAGNSTVLWLQSNTKPRQHGGFLLALI